MAQALRFDEKALRRRAGDTTFERGEDYHADGLVKIIDIEGGTVRAKVLGSELYDVRASAQAGEIAGSCSCPAFADYGFCKHLVATALAVNDLPDEAQSAGRDRIMRIRTWLCTLPAETLADRLIEIARRDPALMKELQLSAVDAGSDGDTIFRQYRTALEDAFAMNGYVDYHEAASWAQGIEAVLDRLEALAGSSHAAVAMRLAEAVFDELDQVFESVDDSDGQLTDIAQRASEIHQTACDAAKPDPVELAAALFRLETGHDVGFAGGIDSYRELLGPAGMAEYRRLAEQAWAAGGDRRLLLWLLDELAEGEGAVDDQIARRRQIASTWADYQELVRFCRTHGRAEEALRWAEEGLWLFEDEAGAAALVPQTARLYRELGRAEEADQLLWRQFERRPDWELFTLLGGTEAGAMVERATALLDARLRKSPENGSIWGSGDCDLLIRILLAARQFDNAWAAAHRHACSPTMKMTLAEATAESHPAEALAVYLPLVEQEIRLTSRPGYEQACRLIERIRAIRERCGRAAEHRQYVLELTHRYRAKRIFREMVTALPIPAAKVGGQSTVGGQSPS